MKTLVTKIYAAAAARRGRRESKRGRPWRVLPPLALALTLLAAPASGHAQPPARRFGCQQRCWARAFIDGSGWQEFDASSRGDQSGHQNTVKWRNLYDVQLESTTAFVISEPLYINADLAGLTLFNGRGTEKRVGCTPQRFDQQVLGAPIDGGLTVIDYGGKGTKLYVDHGWFATSYDEEEKLLRSHKYTWSESSYTCGPNEFPARDSAHFGNNAGFALYYSSLCTLPPSPVDLSLAELIHGGGGQLDYASECHNSQRNEISHTTFTWTVTAKIDIELCPDQSLRHNCALKGHDNLPPPTR